MTNPPSPAAYAFVTDEALKVGDTMPGGDDMSYWSDPRRVDLADALEVHVAEPEDLILLRQPFRLARVATAGPVKLNGHGEITSPSSWTITAFEPHYRAFGPHGALVVALVTEAERLLNEEHGSAAAHRYDAAVDAQRKDAQSLRASIMAAYNALATVGAGHESFWHELGGCAYGNEVLALVARDLIGRTEEWTLEVYDELTRPWRIAFDHPVHPDDQGRPADPRP